MREPLSSLIADLIHGAKEDSNSICRVHPIPAIDWGRIAFIAIVGLFLLALGYSAIYRAAWNEIERTDFTVYRAAGQAVLDGANLYEARNSRGWNYVYPPPFALLMTPFAKLSLAWGSAIWYLISLGGLILPALAFGWQKSLDYWRQWSHRVAAPALSANDARRDNPLYAQLLDKQMQLYRLLCWISLGIWFALLVAAYRRERRPNPSTREAFQNLRPFLPGQFFGHSPFRGWRGGAVLNHKLPAKSGMQD